MVNNTTEAGDSQVPEMRYVHLKGRLEVGINSEGRFTVIFFNEAGNPINEDEPFEITKKPFASIVIASGAGNRIKLDSAELIASFTREAFDRHKATIMQIDPKMDDWSKAELPTPATINDMTPTGPPHSTKINP